MMRKKMLLIRGNVFDIISLCVRIEADEKFNQIFYQVFFYNLRYDAVLREC